MKRFSLHKFLHAAILLQSILLASCAEDTTKAEGPLVPIRLTASGMEGTTRAATNIQSINFDGGEQLNVYFSPSTGCIMDKDGTEISSNSLVYTTTAASNGVNALNAPSDKAPIYFPNGDNVTLGIYALYPLTMTNTSAEFSVANDQTEDKAYKASDLMYAKVSGLAKSDEVIHLQFAHKMAKIIVNATGEDGVTINSVKLTNFKKTAPFTPSSGTLGEATGSGDILISTKGAALIPPQTITSEFMQINCTHEGATKTAYFYIDSKAFVAGKAYTINVSVGEKNLTDDGKVIITGWGDAAGTLTVAPVGSSGLKIEGEVPDVTYNGKAYTPTPQVTDGRENNATTLTLGTHYTLQYYNNTNAGTALIVATGKPGTEYEGITAIKTFTIKKAANTMAYPSASVTTTLSKNSIVNNVLKLPSMQTNEIYGKITYTVTKDQNGTTVASVDANGNVSMKGKGGPVTITATMDDSGNFEAKTVTYQLTINAGLATAMKINLNPDSYSYTGSTIVPNYSITDNGETLVEGVDYQFVRCDNAVNARLATATSPPTLVVQGIGEYTGTTSKAFSITPAITEITIAKAEKILSSTTGTDYTGETRGEKTFANAISTNFGTLTYTYSESGKISIANTAKGQGQTATITAAAVSTGWVTVTIKVASATNWTAAEASMKVKVEEMYRKFTYTGSMQNTTIPNTKKATVVAELIGAGGGKDNVGHGGYGGYVKAQKVYNAGASETWYICCGGAGKSDQTGTGGGWNGGGYAGKTGASGAGGGATDISTTGTAYNNATHIANRFLVAGGGGGSSNSNYGGISAGKIGSNNVGDREDGSWLGEDNSSGTDGGGGGAGYVGGQTGYENNSTGEISGGHGGSNYIASGWTELSNGISTNGSAGGVSTWNGYVYIWYIYEDN